MEDKIDKLKISIHTEISYRNHIEMNEYEKGLMEGLQIANRIIYKIFQEDID